MASVASEFWREVFKGNAKALRAKSLVVKMRDDGKVEVQIVDRDGRVLIHLAATHLAPGGSLTVTDLDRAFDIYLDGRLL